jgi:hypothetical protein
MGASGWSYFVPYDRDVNAALQTLRWDIFRAGKYYKLPPAGAAPAFEDFVPPDPQIWDDPSELASWRAMYDEELKRSSRPAPDSPDALVKHNGEEGTHSIIDIARVNESTAAAGSGPLSASQLVELFGTERPTRSMVSAKESELQTARGRWLCTYVVVYDGETPSELFFTGYSGD